MSIKSSVYIEHNIENYEKHVFWAQRSFQNHHQMFHDRCPEKMGHLPKKLDHWFTQTWPENMGPAPTWLLPDNFDIFLAISHHSLQSWAGQDQGGPKWDTLTKKIKKVNQIAWYCVMIYPRCCSLWPCTFWGLHSSNLNSSRGQTRGSHFNFYWGMDTTMWSYVHFLCFCASKIDFYHQLWNRQVKKLIKQHQICLFLYLKISLNMWQAIQFLAGPDQCDRFHRHYVTQSTLPQPTPPHSLHSHSPHPTQSTLPQPTPPQSTLPQPTPPHSLHSHSPLPHKSTLPQPTPPQSTLPQPTPPQSTLPQPTPPHSLHSHSPLLHKYTLPQPTRAQV